MTFESITGAAALLRQHPILWLAGLVMGALAILAIVVPVAGGAFYAQPLAFLQLLVMPFLAGGVYGMIRAENFSIDEFARSGRTHYFRILLPALLISFVVLLTVILLVVPLALLGAGVAAGASPLIFGVALSIAFFTFFYDTVAVFEETNVFESIRRSIEFVMNNFGRTLVFYLANIVILMVLFLAGIFAWTALLVEKLEPLTLMTPEELQVVMPEDILALIGTEGIWITAVVYGFVIVLYSTFLYAYKASFFRNHSAGGSGAPTMQGEYDEKGRWYKYS
jgi:hypothetical protein